MVEFIRQYVLMGHSYDYNLTLAVLGAAIGISIIATNRGLATIPGSLFALLSMAYGLLAYLMEPGSTDGAADRVAHSFGGGIVVAVPFLLLVVAPSWFIVRKIMQADERAGGTR